MADIGSRAGLYARYSSDLQSENSIEDQLRLCRELATRLELEIVTEEADHAVSGTVLLRPGLQGLLEKARRKEIDVVLTESLDRISRRLTDIAAIHEQLTFNDVRIITLSEGPISEIHIGLGGTLSAIFLKQLGEKTKRGLRGRIEQGRSAGGKAFGYSTVTGHEADDRGHMVIVQEEAEVVRRIFTEYLNGKSPRAIAKALNKEGVEGPSGKGWTASTIIGNRKRGTGFFNNQLYVGKRVWNRLRYRRDPETRKRVSQLNPPEEWIVADVPELRIIDDDQWTRTQVHQESRARETRPDTKRGPDWRQRRPKHLFSGLIKCAACGGGMTLTSRIYYGCATSRNKGMCENRLTMRLDRLEEAVLQGLQERLLTPELTKTFVREYTREVNRLRAEATATHDGTRQRLTTLNRQIANIVDTVAVGRASPALLDRLEKLETEKDHLERDLAGPAPEPVRFHPNVADLYVSKVNGLREALNEDGPREEAAEILRSLVDEIRLHSIDGELQIELIGDLATLLIFAEQKEADKEMPGSLGKPGRTKWLVAGAGFEPATFRL